MSDCKDAQDWYFFKIDSLQKEVHSLRERNLTLLKEVSETNKLKDEIYHLKCQLSKFDDSVLLNSLEVDYALENLTRKRDEYFDFAKIEVHSRDTNIFMKSFLKEKGSFGMRFMTHERVDLLEDGKKRLTEHLIENFVKELEIRWGLYVPRWRRHKDGN